MDLKKEIRKTGDMAWLPSASRRRGGGMFQRTE
jgi:hypothetical protein